MSFLSFFAMIVQQFIISAWLAAPQYYLLSLLCLQLMVSSGTSISSLEAPALLTCEDANTFGPQFALFRALIQAKKQEYNITITTRLPAEQQSTRTGEQEVSSRSSPSGGNTSDVAQLFADEEVVAAAESIAFTYQHVLFTADESGRMVMNQELQL